VIWFALSSVASAEPAWIRTPDLHGQTVVFSASGDLWLAGVADGKARQLTSHSGIEYSPQFSPDGKTVAFSGMYDGNLDVFVIPVTGGEPRRLTWHPWGDEVVGWTLDGKVLYRTGAEHPHGSNELFTVDPAGGDAVKVPLGFAARLTEDPATHLWAFDRIGYERRTWKRYRGGMAGDLWVGDPAKNDFRAVTDTEWGEGFPMWGGGRLWYLSDAGGTADLWSMAADGADRKRHTEGGKWDARTPSMGDDGRIVFVRGGDLKLFDPKSGQETLIPVDVQAERTLTRTRYPWVQGSMTWFTLSPDGDRVLLNVRGELFSVPVEEGPVLPVTMGSGARESWGSYSPDGKRVVYVTDGSGEEALATIDAWGRGDPKTIVPASASGWHFPPEWAPKGGYVAWSDNTQTLWAGKDDGVGSPREIDHADQAEITDYAWSQNGRYLAYVKTDRRDYRSIWVWDSRTDTKQSVSSGFTDDHSPAWDPDGRYLYFVSERGTNPILGGRDFQVVEGRTSRLVLVMLRPDVDDPLATEAGMPDEEPPVVEEKKERKRKRKKSGGEDEEEDKDGTIDFTDIVARQRVLPVERGNYSGLSAVSDGLLYVSYPTVGMAEWASPTLRGIDLEDLEESELGEINAYEVAMNGEKMVVSTSSGLYVTDASVSSMDLSEGAVDLAGVVVELDPREEWRQIFFEGWRHMRDFHWDPTFGGLDWDAIRDQYAALLPRISTRAELSDLMGEMIGELATSHTYIWGGDNPMRLGWVSTGLLGADFVREGDAFKVTRIYRGDPADELDSPLQQPGNVVKEGEYVLAVNHRPFRADRPFLAELQGKVDVPVVLTVNSTNSKKGARDVVVTTLWDDNALRYADWVRRNREYVTEKSGGKFGYLHVPDMGAAGLTAFETWFYPQLDKEGLVVDVRWNGGGFVSQLLLERLGRELTGFDRARGGGIFTYPYRVLNGPFVVITNEFAGSDGDIFPKAVQDEGLAPVIGERSWGGIVGIRADKAVVDGGVLTQPEFAGWYPKGGWIVENHGVDPDIVVQNLPQELVKGVDAQLDRAIAELTARRAAEPPIVPEFGPAPKKTRDAFGDELQKP
jgi:tricorn protease